VIGPDARRGEVQRRALLLRDLRDGRVDLRLREKASLSAVSVIRSKRSVSSRTAASPRLRTSAMIAATASSTSGASSRFIDRSAVNAVSKSASVVFRNTGIRSTCPPRPGLSFSCRPSNRSRRGG
jgi:hypothetical protein